MPREQASAEVVGFHSGELAVQRRAGVQAQAARLRPMMAPGELRGGAPAFLAHASFAALTARDRDGGVWASPPLRPPGFITAATPTPPALRGTLARRDP